MADNKNMDPMQLMRDWFVQSEKMWSDAMTEVMADERVAEGSGRFMQEALHTQRMFSESMGQYLSNMNMPSRTDILDLKDRVSQMEDSVNMVLVELREMRAEKAPVADAPAKKKPTRTRKAAPKKAAPKKST
jgi:hypothetical protein